MTIKNLSGATMKTWTLAWSFGGNQRITEYWNGVASQTNKNVKVKNASWNGNLANGASTSFGFNATYTGTNAIPASFTLNGLGCTRQ